jgi:cytochrome c biogenesis protein CcmG/thiol:disulfide interchange protein DsbE
VVAIVGALTVWVVTSDDGATTGRSTTEQQLPASEAPRAGTAAPAFDLRTLRRHHVSVESLRGRPVVVNFWASYCHPCRQEFPLLKSALQEHRRDRLAVVGVVHDDIPSDARAFVKDEHATWPMGVDEDGTVSRAYGVRAIPQTFFVDRDGTIRARVFGEMSARDLQRNLRKIIPPT